MDKRVLWDHIVAERVALREQLRTLTPEEWDAPSLCDGWRVRDVAAHVIAAPQLTWGPTLKVLPQMWRGYNGAILHDGLRRGAAEPAAILADYDRWAEVRRGPATVTSVEPLIDILLHTQDILRPLGRTHAMPVDAAMVAADRVRLLAPLMGSSHLIRGVRMEATDADWSRGRGPVLRGPMAELLMRCSGRPADLPAPARPPAPAR